MSALTPSPAGSVASSAIEVNDGVLAESRTGASLTAVPVTAFEPLTERLPSDTLVAIAKLPLKFEAGVNVSPARSALTLAIPPDAVHTPVPASYVDVTAPEVPL